MHCHCAARPGLRTGVCPFAVEAAAGFGFDRSWALPPAAEASAFTEPASHGCTMPPSAGWPLPKPRLVKWCSVLQQGCLVLAAPGARLAAFRVAFPVLRAHKLLAELPGRVLRCCPNIVVAALPQPAPRAELMQRQPTNSWQRPAGGLRSPWPATSIECCAALCCCLSSAHRPFAASASLRPRRHRRRQWQKSTRWPKWLRKRRRRMTRTEPTRSAQLLRANARKQTCR